MQIFENILWLLVLIGVMIMIHELGHFWVARKLGMTVEEFAIGFGPKIYSRKRDGIEYSLRGIPAGGFVKLPQMVTSQALEGQTTENVPPAPPLHKILTAFAGPFMNIVLAVGCLTGLYMVKFQRVAPEDMQAVIGHVMPDSPAARRYRC